MRPPSHNQIHPAPSAVGIGHPTVREYLNVKHNRAPRPRGAVALEGLWALQTALAAGAPIDSVFVSNSARLNGAALAAVQAAGARGARLLTVSERVLARMVDRDGPDGLAALAHLPAWTFDDIAIGPPATVVIADRIDLAGNLGTLIRCADGSGAAGVILSDRRLRSTHPLVVKASMGTLFSTPLVDAARDEAVRWLRRHGFRLVVADPDGDTSYRDVDYSGRVAIVVGNERHGLDAVWRAEADVRASIPMLGVADSLNVGHAAALLLYEALDAQKGGDRTVGDLGEAARRGRGQRPGRAPLDP